MWMRCCLCGRDVVGHLTTFGGAKSRCTGRTSRPKIASDRWLLHLYTVFPITVHNVYRAGLEVCKILFVWELPCDPCEQWEFSRRVSKFFWDCLFLSILRLPQFHEMF